MEQLTGRFEADGPDGRAHTVLVFTRLTAEPGGVVASERMATADGLTVVLHGQGHYYAVLTGARLSRRPPGKGPEPDGGPMPERRVGTRHQAPAGRLFRVEAPDGATAAFAVLEEAGADGVR